MRSLYKSERKDDLCSQKAKSSVFLSVHWLRFPALSRISYKHIKKTNDSKKNITVNQEMPLRRRGFPILSLQFLFPRLQQYTPPLQFLDPLQEHFLLALQSNFSNIRIHPPFQFLHLGFQFRDLIPGFVCRTTGILVPCSEEIEILGLRLECSCQFHDFVGEDDGICIDCL